MSKAWQAYALHILDAIEKIRRIVQRGNLTRDDVLYAATLRNLQTLSEATQRLPDALKQSRPEIPWKRISGFRNILVHNYLGEIDAPLTKLWRVRLLTYERKYRVALALCSTACRTRGTTFSCSTLPRYCDGPTCTV